MNSLQELAWKAYLIQLIHRRPSAWCVSAEPVVTFKNGIQRWEDMCRRHFPGPFLMDVVMAIEEWMDSPGDFMFWSWTSIDPDKTKKRGRLVYEEFVENSGILFERYTETEEHFIKRLKNAI